MISYGEFADNCKRLEERIRKAADASGRKFEEVAVLPVTKTHPVAAAQYSAQYGFKSVGENRVQEAVEKIAQNAADIEWELIGHLQTNKAKAAAANFARIQSVDSIKLLAKLDKEAAEISKTQRVLLQINAGRDPAKFGAEIEEAPALLECALGLENISVEGLMTIAPLDEDLDTASHCFANLRNLRDGLETKFSVKLRELSMGMSGDLERAIAEGSTVIRVGSFLFGEREHF